MVRAFLLAVTCAGCCSLAAQTPPPSAPAQVCVKELLTPIRHVCGIIDQGERDGPKQQVLNAILTLMQDGKVVGRAETNDKASFDFTEKLTHGSYDLIVEAANHTPNRFRIIVRKPIEKCSKGSLWLTLPLDAGCGEIKYWKFRYVDFEAPVWTREPAQLASVVN